MQMRWVVVAFLFAGCSTQQWQNTGQACIIDPVALDTDGSVVSVVLDSCISGSIEITSRRCEITVDANNVVTIEAEAVGRVPRQLTDDCNDLTVDCELSELGAGTYTVRYGDQSVMVEVPYSGPEICLGE